MSTNKYNMTIWQGSTFGLTILAKNPDKTAMDLTSYSARMQIRPTYASGTVVESLTSANGEINIVTAEGKLELSLSAARTANIKVDLGSSSKPPKTVYVYDLELIDNANTVTKLLYGDVNVLGEVTR
jgi:hypothetical protein